MASVWRRIGLGDDEWVGCDPSERFPVYTRGNAGEVYPEVYTPLSFSIAQASGEQAMRNAALATGVLRRKEVEGVPLSTAVASGVFGGYAYLNLSLNRVLSHRVPGGRASDADATYLGTSGVGGQQTPPPHVRRKGDRNLLGAVAGIRYALGLLRTDSLAELAADQRRVAEFLASLPDPAAATDEELRLGTTDRIVDLLMQLFARHLEISSAAGTTMALLQRICADRLDDPALAVTLVSALGDVDSAAPSAALWELGRRVRDSAALTAHFDAGVHGLAARLAAAADADHGDEPGVAAEASAAAEVAAFRSAFAAFIGEFGARGPNEWDTAFDTWETRPELALVLVDRMRFTDASHAPVAQRERLAADRDRAEAAARERLSRLDRRIFTATLRAARRYAQARERTKTTVVRAIHGARLQAQELDRRLVARSGGQRGDLWFLVAEELDAYAADPASFAGVIADRRQVHAELRRRIPPFFFTGTIPPAEEWELRDVVLPNVVVGERITGLPGCPGVARGRARVVLDPSDPRGLEPGDVLVAPITDPSWTPLFVPAEAVVVDVGAVMSHAVIVSRELGIPCAVSVADASRRIPDGAEVEVDGSTGTVTVVALPDAR